MTIIKARPNQLISLIFLTVFTPLIINALMQQLTAVSSGISKSYFLPFSALTLISILSYILIRKKLIINVQLFLSLLLFTTFTSILAIRYISINDLSYTIAGYYSYGMIYATLIGSFAPSFIAYRTARGFLYSIALISCTIGIVQYLTNSPLLSVSDASGSFKISSYLYTETFPYRVRGFSLFNSALEFGYFIIFCVGIVVYDLRSRKYISWSILAVILLAGFATLTRNIYFGIILATCASIFYRTRLRNKWVLYVLPILSFVLGILVNYHQVSGGGLSSSTSLQIRQEYWQQEIARQAEASSSSFILGDGIYQSGDADSGKLFVDNTYLQLIAQFGVVGAMLFLLVYFNLLKFSLSLKNSAIGCGLFSFLVSWPFLALFNICIQPIGIFAILAMVTRHPSAIEEKLCKKTKPL